MTRTTERRNQNLFARFSRHFPEDLSKVLLTMPNGDTYNGRYKLSGDLGLARWAKVDVEDPAAMAEFYGVSMEEYKAGQEQTAEMPMPKV